MGLGVTTGSTNKDLAWTYVTFMTSQPVQNKYAQLSLPIWKSSYDDPAVAKGQEEIVKAAKTAIAIMVPRPQLVSYQELSTILQAQIQKVLLGSATPEAALAEVTAAAAKLQ
jgi:multiple sugar transport system substrate-binding protein